MWYAVRFLGCVCVVAVCGGWYGGTVFVFAVFGVPPCCVCACVCGCVRVSSVRCIVCMVHMHGACSLSVLPVLCFLVRFSIRKKKGLYI